MTYYDVAMAGVVIAGMVWGALRGITWQIASIASLVLGYSVAHPLSVQLAPQFPGEPVVARALAMLVIYAAVSGGVFFAAWVVRATLRKMQFEAYDRHLGMVLGGLEGALIGMVATFFVVSLAPQARTPIFSSPTGKVVGQIMATLGPVLPTEARTALAPFWNAEDGAVAADDGDTAKPNAGSSVPLVERVAERIEGRDKTRDDQSKGDAASSLKNLIEKEETRIGKAFVETAEKELGQSGTGGTNDGTVERR